MGILEMFRIQGSQWRGRALLAWLGLAALCFLGLFAGAARATDSLPGAANVSSALNERPNLNGIWQALSSAYWNIEAHAASVSPVPDSGAFGAASAGVGILLDANGEPAPARKLPYLETAAAQAAKNFAARAELDPARKCYMPGVPRATYMPYPLQLVQTEDHVFIAYEFAGASRTIYMDRPEFVAPVDSWMGHSIGRWEGDTLVVDVSAQVADTWLDRAGNHHSDEMQVTERYRLLGPNHLQYTATITDRKTFSEPWTLSLPLYRRIEPNAQLLEFRCIEFVEELMYGELAKKESGNEGDAK